MGTRLTQPCCKPRIGPAAARGPEPPSASSGFELGTSVGVESGCSLVALWRFRLKAKPMKPIVTSSPPATMIQNPGSDNIIGPHPLARILRAADGQHGFLSATALARADPPT